MYEAFYGLKEKPFSILPDPSFLFWSEQHSQAYTMLEYGVYGNTGMTVITGEIGAGKTTLLRHFLNHLPPEITVGLLSNIQAGRGPLLEWVMASFGLDLEARSDAVLYRKFQDFLIQEYSAGRRTVLIIDEAQNLDVKTLEELRMMSNINSEKYHLLQIILAGQPELRDRLRSPQLVQFAQRVTSEYHLGVLNATEIIDYIHSRLIHAGAERPLFTAEACRVIYQASRGTPRLINLLCDLSLTYGFAEGAEMISDEIVGAVLADRRRYGALTATS